MKKKIGFILIISLLLIGGAILFNKRVEIEDVTLSSPFNSALQEDIKVVTDKPVRMFARYWISGDDKQFQTTSNKRSKIHLIHLILLKPNTRYKFQVIIKRRFFRRVTKIFSFKTREQSTWLIHNWRNPLYPYDASSLDNGFVMVCNGNIPGYIALLDAKGNIRWYWQDDTMGVRAATLTPRGTLLALLDKPTLDTLDDVHNTKEKKYLDHLNAPIRRGRIGFAAGTSITEIALDGRQMWQLNIKNSMGYFCIHHDLRMDEDHNIVALTRDPLVITDSLRRKLGLNQDTLWGDAIIKIDTLGKILWKWSPWEKWNVAKDPKIKQLWYDRFHLNALWICKDGDYLVSSALENQIWKINTKKKRVLWSLGKGGSIKMDSNSYFYFQHDVNIDSKGDILLFDNGDFSPFNKISKGKDSKIMSFRLNTKENQAEQIINLKLPHDLYSSRMGSAYLLPNNNLLVTSAKKETILVLSPGGKVLLELNPNFIPYRSEYIPPTVWRKYFTMN